MSNVEFVRHGLHQRLSNDVLIEVERTLGRLKIKEGDEVWQEQLCRDGGWRVIEVGGYETDIHLGILLFVSGRDFYMYT